MTAPLTESVVEEAALEWFAALGYSVVSGPAHALGPGLGRSAERAILQCGPYRLPAEKFQTWSDIEATFDPKDL